MQMTTIGLDLAKHVFRAHGVDARGRVVLRQRLRRAEVVLRLFAELPPCLVAMEACAAAHHWARELMALGHEARLLPPAYVKPYVKRGKSDAVDAEAICCEAATRPSMRFVPVKGAEQQAVLVLHRTRELLIRQRTMLVNALLNALRAHLAEFGIVAPRGIRRVPDLAAALEDAAAPIPEAARAALGLIVAQPRAPQAGLSDLDRRIVAWCRGDDAARRLATIPGVGPVTASALAATVADPSAFRSARHFVAWLGLVPKQNSTGGKTRPGRISKTGDRYLRELLVVGMTAVIRCARRTRAPALARVNALLERRPARLVTVALANKTARVAWAILARRGEVYRAPAASAA